MKKQTNNKNPGFSLFEALVSMLVLSLFFIASSRIITQKHETEIQRTPHGYYECYYDGGSLYEHLHDATHTAAPTPVESGENCVFTPPKDAEVLNINYYDSTFAYTSQQVLMNEDEIVLTRPSDINSDEGATFKIPVQVQELTSEVLKDCEQQGKICMTQEQLNEYAKQSKWQFKTYLKLSHPTSGIYKAWGSGDDPAGEAVMIAW